MNRRILVGILIAFVGVGLIILGVIVIGRIMRQSLAPLPVPTAPPAITQKVLVTTHDLALGDIIKEGDLTLADMPVELVPRDALSEVNLALGRFTKVPLVTGEMVLEHHLADPTNVNHDIPFVIGDDAVLMAFPASDLMSSLAILQRGDLIDILVSYELELKPGEVGEDVLRPDEEQEPEKRIFTFDALQRVEIQAVVAEIIQEGRTIAESLPEGEETPQGLVPSQVNVRAYLLAVAPQDALVLKNLRDSGALFDLVLRSPTSTQLFELSPVLSEYLIDRYKLEITR